MDDEAFVRERIRRARKEKGLSQQAMGRLFQLTQATISDIERGRVQVTAGQLMRFAQILGKPITYFFPSGIGGDTSSLESELIDSFRSLPESWQRSAAGHVKTQLQLYEQVQEYVRAGIPLENLAEVMYIDVVPTEEGLPLKGLAEEDMQRVERLLQTAIPSDPFDVLAQQLDGLDAKIRQEFFEGSQPIEEEDQKEGELHLANLKRFVEWLRYLKLKYGDVTEGE
jgi:transcriptional regulator with XRE-family HTH domain